MRRILRLLLVFVLIAGVVGGLIFAYLKMSKERAREAERETPVVAKPRTKLGTNGETIVTVDAEAQKRIALKIEPVRQAQLDQELKGYGRVLDPLPLVTLAAELSSAQAAWGASQKEFERLKVLNEQKNASERALQTAEAAARRDQIAVESVRTRLLAGWGSAISQRLEQRAFIESLATLETALVRIDLPAGEMLSGRPIRARIFVGSRVDQPITAELLGPAAQIDPQMQGQAFLFLVKGSSQTLASGLAVTGYLQLPGGSLNGFFVPDSAVVRHNNKAWVYVQTGADAFVRRNIALDRRMDDGWIVTKNVASNDQIVVIGAQALLSEEEKNQIKMRE
jgi:hypothetical protein